MEQRKRSEEEGEEERRLKNNERKEVGERQNKKINSFIQLLGENWNSIEKADSKANITKSQTEM